MENVRRKTALMISNGLLAAALSAAFCLAQTSPPQTSASGASSQSAASAEASSPDKVVLKVGEDKVTKADVDYLIGSLSPQLQQAVASRGRKPVGDEYALMLLLSQKAKSEHLDTSPDFQRKLALQKLQMLAQDEYRKMAEDIQVSPEEVNAYYNAHKSDFDEAQVREVVVRKKPADSTSDAPGLSADEAKARLAEIQKAIESGTDIKEVAKKFDVPNVVMVYPDPQTVRRGEMIPALDKAAFELKDNQFSQPVDTPQAMVLLQVLSHQQPDAKTVSGQIENQLRQEKLQTAVNDMKAKANIWMDPDYFKSAEGSADTSATPKAPANP
jgi:parvulin-like peptidyl-prolyl isomerase